jgi:drug/metabolite transporter (DMT)-like permease
MGDVTGLAASGTPEMSEGSAAAGVGGPGRPLPPTAAWRRRVLAAPGLAVLGVLLVVAAAVFDDQHGKRASALCHRLPVPWTLYALAWGSLLCGLAASVLCALLVRAARREGRRGTESWQGTLAVCICVAGVLPLLFEAMAVYGVHSEAGEAYWKCAGAAALLG